MMVPLIENLALEGDSLAKHLINEHDKTQDNLKLVNMDAHAFIADNEENKPSQS